jgi:hypothetical protein
MKERPRPNASKTNRLLKQLKEGDYYGESVEPTICNALSVLKNKKAAPEEACNIGRESPPEGKKLSP